MKNYIQIFVGSIVFAAGIALFLSPNNLAPGGLSGVSIIITEFIDLIPVGTWVAILNVPIMLLGIWKLGFKILLPTLIAIALSSLSMNLFEAYVPVITENEFLACVAGGVCVGVGIGLVFRGGATTGGTDIIVKIIRLKYRHISTGTTFLIVDGMICVASGIVFGNIEKAIFAAIALFIQMYVLNTVLYGSDEARLVYIISQKDDEIAAKLLKDADIGATYLYGCRAYTGKEKKVLMCAVRMRILPQAKEIVRKVDEDAFVIVTKATTVIGQGFKNPNEEEL